jgi:DNA adenine methylase
VLVTELVECCRNDPTLLDVLKTPTRKEYYDVRDNPQKYQTWYRGAVLLFGSYNARVYGGCYGATAKTKDGRERNYFEEAKRNFERQLPNLKGILIGNCDYRHLRFPQAERVLIYCDPPYDGGIGYADKFDTAEFFDWCREQAKNGHIVFVSEYAAPNDFCCVWEKKTKTHLNNRQNIERTEKLFVIGGAQWHKYTN